MTEVHDINSPSRLALRERCPGSARIEASMPPRDDNEYSARGKRLHAIMARCLQTNRMPTLADVNDDADDYAAVSFAWEAIAAIEVPPGALRLIEYRTELDHVGIEHPGTVDCAVVIPGSYFHCIDFKFGMQWVPSPRYNRQFHGYLIGLAHDYGCTSGHASLIQPALERVECDAVSTEDLANWRSQVRRIVSRAREPDAPLVTGSWCDSADCRHACPALAQVAHAHLVAPAIDAVASIQALPPAGRCAQYERMRIARAWLDSAIAAADAAILSGRLQVPGLAIGAGRSSRVWADESKATSVLTTLLGKDAAYTTKLLSPAQAEKVLKARGHKAAALSPLIATVAGSPRVMRDGSGGLIE